MTPDEFKQCEELRRAAAAGRLDPNVAIAELRRIEAGGTSSTSAIVIPMYLAKLTADDLASLSALAERIRRRSARLAAWLDAAIRHECRRRDSLDGAMPIEAMFPQAQSWLTWTGAELADALQAITIASYGTKPNLVAKFVDKMVVLMTAIVRSKLSERG